MQTSSATHTVAALLISVNWKTSYCLFPETPGIEMFTQISVWTVWKNTGGQWDTRSMFLNPDLCWDVQTLPVQWPDHLHHQWLPHDTGDTFIQETGCCLKGNGHKSFSQCNNSERSFCTAQLWLFLPALWFVFNFLQQLNKWEDCWLNPGLLAAIQVPEPAELLNPTAWPVWL